MDACTAATDIHGRPTQVLIITAACIQRGNQAPCMHACMHAEIG